MDSVETWRLYSAEASIRQRMPSNYDRARLIARQITSSAWWRMLPERPTTIDIELGGHEVGGMVASHSYPRTSLLPTEWVLSLHPDRSTERTVIHELAHTIAPRFTTSLDGATLPISHHGPLFAGVYVEMLQRYSQLEDPQPLLEAIDDYQVHPCLPDAWRAAVASSIDIERALLATGAAAPTDPPDIFGASLIQARTTTGQTQAALAKLLGCRRSRLNVLESMPVPPTHGTAREFAVRAAVAYGMDPIEMTEIYHLNWSADAATEWPHLNPRWAAHLEDLNDLLTRRPPWWQRRP